MITVLRLITFKSHKDKGLVLWIVMPERHHQFIANILITTGMNLEMMNCFWWRGSASDYNTDECRFESCHGLA